MTHDTPDITLIVCPPIILRFPHIGVAYLAAQVEKHGFRPRVFDLNLALHKAVPEASRRLWQRRALTHWLHEDQVADFVRLHDAELQAVVTEALVGDPPWVGLSIQLASFLLGMELVRRLKRARPDLRIVVGGSAFYLHASPAGPVLRSYGFPLMEDPGRRSQLEEWLERIDLVVLGEGEETLVEILARGGPGSEVPEGVPGTARFRRGGYQVAPPRPLMADLDQLPIPAYHQFPLQDYEEPVLPLLGARGCPMRCAFCTERQIWGRVSRRRSVENLLAEVAYHGKQFGRQSFEFVDMSLNHDLRWLHQFCETVRTEQIRMAFGANMIVQRQMDAAFYQRLRTAGGQSFIFGIESGSSRVLRRMNKAFYVEDACENLKHCHEAGMPPIINLIVGFPLEAEADFRQTCGFLTQNREYIQRVELLSICTVFKDSDMAREPERFGILPETIGYIDDMFEITDWVDKNGLDFAARHERYDRLLFHLEDLGLALPTMLTDGQPASSDVQLTSRDVEWLNALTTHTAGRSLFTIVRSALDHPDPPVRASALRLVGGLRDQALLGRIHQALNDRVKEVRREAMLALGLLANPESLDKVPALGERLTASPTLEMASQGRLRLLHDIRGCGGKKPQTGHQPSIEIVGLDTLDEAGQSASIFHQGGPFQARMRLSVRRPVQNPVVRFQIYRRKGRGWDATYLTESQSRSHLDHLGCHRRGETPVFYRIPRLHLPEGRYALTVMVLPDELARVPYDIRRMAQTFSVREAPQGQAAPGNRLSLEAVHPLSQTRAWVTALGETLEIISPDGEPLPFVQAGEPLRVRATASLPEGAAVSAYLNLGVEGQVLTSFPLGTPLPAGENQLDFVVDELPLLEGQYRATLHFVEAATGGPVGRAMANLKVNSDGRRDGFGVFFHRASFAVPDEAIPDVVLQGLDILDEDGGQVPNASPGKPLRLDLHYRVVRPVPSLMVVLSIVARERPGWNGRMVYSTGTPLSGMRLGTHQPGFCTLRFSIARLNLQPGRYVITVGAYDGRDPSRCHDAHHGAYELLVGEPGQTEAGVAMMEIATSPLTAEESALTEGEATLLDARGQPALAGRTGAPLSIRMPASSGLRASEGLGVRIWLGDGPTTEPGPVLDLALAPVPEGQAGFRLDIASLNLLPGRYTLELRPLPDDGTGQAQLLPLPVVGAPGLAEGVVYCPTLASLPRGQQAPVVITGCELLGADGQACDQFIPEEPAALVTSFFVREPTRNPLLRLQLFTLHSPTWDRTPLFTVATSREQQFLGTLEKGERTVVFELPRLPLLPGLYQWTVGLWPDETTTAPLDIHHGSYVFTILGEPLPDGAVIPLPCESATPEPLASASAAETDALLALERTAAEDEGLQWTSGEPGRMGLVTRLASADGHMLQIRVLRDDRALAFCEIPGPIRPGPCRLDLTFDPVGLVPGRYLLEAALVETASGRAFAQVRTPLFIRGPEATEPALILLPEGTRWIVRDELRPPLTFTDVELLDLDGAPCRTFRSGDGARLELGYRVEHPVPGALLRCQVFPFTQGSESRALLFGTNTLRAGLTLPTETRGEHRLCLHLDRLALGPGGYQFTLGLWPEVESPIPLDLREGACRFSVADTPHSTGFAGLAPRLETQVLDLLPEGEDSRFVTIPRLVAADGTAALQARTGQALVVEVDADLAPLTGLVATVRAGDTLLFHGRREGPLPTGRIRLRLVVETLDLQGGTYELGLRLDETATGRTHHTTALPLVVVAEDADGAGLVHLPVRWDLTDETR